MTKIIRNIKITDDSHTCNPWCRPPRFHTMVARSNDERFGSTPEFWNDTITGRFIADGDDNIRVIEVERAWENDGFDAEGQYWPVSWLLTLEFLE